MTPGVYLAIRFSLSFLWVFTGITSGFFAQDIGYEILAGGKITGSLASFCIFSGSILDVFIGVWLLTGKWLKFCYLVQLVVIAFYSLLLTILAPEFWLHPFGPLTKNLPLLAMIYYLYNRESKYLARKKDDLLK